MRDYPGKELFLQQMDIGSWLRRLPLQECRQCAPWNSLEGRWYRRKDVHDIFRTVKDPNHINRTTGRSTKMKKALASISIIVALALAAIPVSAFEDLYPTEAYDLVTSKDKAYIIDVRSPEEWKWVGHPGENWLGEGADLEGKVFNIPWFIFPGGTKTVNPTFVEEVDAIFGDRPNAELVMMCRSGVRGVFAANKLEAAGYNSHKIYNMVTGFEGDKDARGYRIINGWRFEGLPYAY